MKKSELQQLIKEEIQKILKEESIEIEIPNNIKSDLEKNGFKSLNDLFKKEKKAQRDSLSQETKKWIQSTLRPKFMQNKILKEILARDSPSGKKLDILFNKLVPNSGHAKTLHGELVRAASRIGHRWYNDGDKFFEGYGTETAGPCMSFLIECNKIDPNIKNQIREAAKKAEYNHTDSAYEQFLEKLFNIIIKYIESTEDTPNSEDMFDYKSLWYDDPNDYEDDDY